MWMFASASAKRARLKKSHVCKPFKRAVVCVLRKPQPAAPLLGYNLQVNRLRHPPGLILALLLLIGLLASLAWQPASRVEPAAIAIQYTRTPRPAVIHPTRRPTRTPTVPITTSVTAFRTLPATAARQPTQPPAPPPVDYAAALPASAQVEGLIGYGQTLPLSCESRSAVDWARFFGVEIGEMAFFARLPASDDPETGFVGSVNGVWGQIPPSAYGVHAEPVAQLLREYGLPARAARNLPLTAALAEVAAGRPVVVWVTGHVEPGRGVAVTINEQVRRVARYEHTVILIGYDDHTDLLTFQDGAKVYDRPVEVFLRAWEPLENMAVVWEGE